MLSLISDRRTELVRCFIASTFLCGAIPTAEAFILGSPEFEPWQTTASGSRSGNGQAVTLTWSIIPDNTTTPGLNPPPVGSDFIDFLDDAYNIPNFQRTSDLTQREWFEVVEQPFERWSEISGINFVYEPNDDGTAIGAFGSGGGALGTRGDIRLGGRAIDGPSGTLAFAFLPSGSFSDGDVVFDTADTGFFSNPVANNLPLRQVIAHELGHSLGLEHVESNTDGLLLEPIISLGFDGPQLDEVRAAHFFFGDIHEQSNNNQGNETAALATSLGLLSSGVTRSIGTDADVPTQFISADATDFVSISNLDDTDFFSFTVDSPGRLDVTLTPHGGQFAQGSEGTVPTPFNADNRSNLSFDVIDTDGSTVLAAVNNGAAGISDVLEDLELADSGEYFIRITGAADTIQLYQLDLELMIAPTGDLNGDGIVDAGDFTAFASSFGSTAGGFADGNSDGVVNAADFTIFRDSISSASGVVLPVSAVPEPTTGLLVSLAAAAITFPRKRRR